MEKYILISLLGYMIDLFESTKLSNLLLFFLHCDHGNAGFTDDEVYYYHINLDEYIANKRLKRQPSQAKNGAKFRCANSSFYIFSLLIVKPL